MKINWNGKIRTRKVGKVSWWKKSAGAARLFEELQSYKTINNADLETSRCLLFQKTARSGRRWILKLVDRQQARVVTHKYKKDQEGFGKPYQKCSWEEGMKYLQDLSDKIVPKINHIDKIASKILNYFKLIPLIESLQISPE